MLPWWKSWRPDQPSAIGSLPLPPAAHRYLPLRAPRSALPGGPRQHNDRIAPSRAHANTAPDSPKCLIRISPSCRRDDPWDSQRSPRARATQSNRLPADSSLAQNFRCPRTDRTSSRTDTEIRLDHRSHALDANSLVSSARRAHAPARPPQSRGHLLRPAVLPWLGHVVQTWRLNFPALRCQRHRWRLRKIATRGRRPPAVEDLRTYDEPCPVARFSLAVASGIPGRTCPIRMHPDAIQNASLVLNVNAEGRTQLAATAFASPSPIFCRGRRLRRAPSLPSQILFSSARCCRHRFGLSRSFP